MILYGQKAATLRDSSGMCVKAGLTSLICGSTRPKTCQPCPPIEVIGE